MNVSVNEPSNADNSGTAEKIKDKPKRVYKKKEKKVEEVTSNTIDEIKNNESNLNNSISINQINDNLNNLTNNEENLNNTNNEIADNGTSTAKKKKVAKILTEEEKLVK